MARRINLLSKRERKTLTKNMWTARAQQVERAAEILEEEFNAFLRELEDNSGSSSSNGLRSFGLGGWDLEVTRSDAVTYKGVTVKSLTAFVDHPVFNILDEGREDVLYFASDYGHKAWPMVTPRREDFGSQPVTTPDTLDLNQGHSDQPIIFRPYFRGGLQARNYTQQLFLKAQARIDKEGLKVALELRNI